MCEESVHEHPNNECRDRSQEGTRYGQGLMMLGRYRTRQHTLRRIHRRVDISNWLLAATTDHGLESVSIKVSRHCFSREENYVSFIDITKIIECATLLALLRVTTIHQIDMFWKCVIIQSIILSDRFISISSFRIICFFVQYTA